MCSVPPSAISSSGEFVPGAPLPRNPETSSQPVAPTCTRLWFRRSPALSSAPSTIIVSKLSIVPVTEFVSTPVGVISRSTFRVQASWLISCVSTIIVVSAMGLQSRSAFATGTARPEPTASAVRISRASFFSRNIEGDTGPVAMDGCLVVDRDGLLATVCRSQVSFRRSILTESGGGIRYGNRSPVILPLQPLIEALASCSAITAGAVRRPPRKCALPGLLL